MSLLERPIISCLSNNSQILAPFYGTGTYFTVFTRILHWSLFWAKFFQPPPSIIFLISILILSSRIPHSFQSYQVSYFTLTPETSHDVTLTPLRITFPSHLILLDMVFVTTSGEVHKLRICSLRNTFPVRNMLITTTATRWHRLPYWFRRYCCIFINYPSFIAWQYLRDRRP